MNSMKLTAFLLCTVAATTVGEDFDLSWHSFDSGGVIRSTGGDFELSGTIGQPDAGTLAGGDFELNGGFWFEVPASDCNADGVLNLFDYGSFIECLSGPDIETPIGCECQDSNRSGTVDLLDFAALQLVNAGL